MIIRGIKKLLRITYAKMQENYISFRLLVWLEECGIVERLMVLFSPVGKRKEDQANYRESSRAFYEANKEKVNKVIDLLEDEKSKNVYRACIEKRCCGKRIKSGLFDERDQYFDNEIICLEHGEVFVDCGAFIGDTVQQLKNRMIKKKINNFKVVAFEPSERNASLIQKFFKKDARVILVKKGVSNKCGKLYFTEQGPKSRSVNNPSEATGIIEVTALDNESECKDATFIKMDIEGLETDAIMGAERIIKANKPKLAICIYHSNEDMVNIPLLIKNMVPEYKLYIRHHSMGTVETVLYAV